MAPCCSVAHCDLGKVERQPPLTSKCIPANVSPAAKFQNLKASSSHSFVTRSHDRFDDVEKGHSNESVHVSVVITGMTCTGCAKKAMNALSRISGVKSSKVNFVASVGEFDLDHHLDPVRVISRLECETGFKCSRLVRDLQQLEVVMTNIDAKLSELKLPVGIDSVLRTDKNICRITFDPTAIGARSVMSFVSSNTLARPRNDGAYVDSQRRLVYMAWITAISSVCTIPIITVSWSNTSIPYFERSVAALILATCVQAIAVSEFFVGALKSLFFGRVVEMDMLIAISTMAAYGYSVVAFGLTTRGCNLAQQEIFETSSLLTTLVLLGRLISLIARMKAFAAVSMKSLQVGTALLTDRVGKTTEIDARLLEYGDTVIVPPHAKIVTDGKIIRGAGEVDESTITGESTFITKKVDDLVIAGTINGSFPLAIRVARLPGQNSITDLADIVGSALTEKPRIQNLADRVASWFIPAVLVISSITFIVWILIAIAIRNERVARSIGLALSYSIAVLAVSCPCALGLAVPMVLVIAGGVAARSGVIIKQASVTERAFRTTDVVFDKTGTLTMGRLEVIGKEYCHPRFQQAKIEPVVLALIENNSHPVSLAVTGEMHRQCVGKASVKEIQSIPGCGIKAEWKEKSIKAGSPYWLGMENHPTFRRLVKQGATLLGATIDSELVAAYALKSTLRPEAQAVIEDLQQRKITSHIVSGDSANAVENIARTVGIQFCNIASCQSPTDKQEYVTRLIDQGKTVLFCGDGTNDAVAVAQAHTGVQFGSASDITRATADVVLTGSLEGIPTLLSISKAAYERIMFNFGWSAIYNLLAILLAAGAFVKIRIPPAYAGLGEIVSILPVILVALSLLRSRS